MLVYSLKAKFHETIEKRARFFKISLHARILNACQQDHKGPWCLSMELFYFFLIPQDLLYYLAHVIF